MRRALVCLAIAVPAVLALLAVPAVGQEPPYPPPSTTGPTPSTAPPTVAPTAAPVAPRPAEPTRRAEGLAITGSETWLLVWVAVAALAVGTVLVVGARRRAATRASLRTP